MSTSHGGRPHARRTLVSRTIALATIALATIVLVALAMGACAGGDTPTAPATSPCAAAAAAGVRISTASDLTTWAVIPSATDGCITLALDSHYVYRAPAVSPAGKLLLFLPGTGAKPFYYQLILVEAARAGYHAMAVAYPNDDAIGVICATQPASCYGDARLEVVTGQSASALVNVDRGNSIENRVVKLLHYMKAIEPAGNWGQFLTGDTIVAWSKVSVAGHSQGGGHALFIAQRYAVWRATAYGSYGDGLPNSGGAAPWVLRPFATPANRIFGFISAFDEVVGPLLAFSAWTSIGLSGDVVNVDDGPPPYGTSQRFYTNAAPINRLLASSPNHNAVVLDLNTPRTGAAQAPVFAKVWRALSFP